MTNWAHATDVNCQKALFGQIRPFCEVYYVYGKVLSWKRKFARSAAGGARAGANSRKSTGYTRVYSCCTRKPMCKKTCVSEVCTRQAAAAWVSLQASSFASQPFRLKARMSLVLVVLELLHNIWHSHHGRRQVHALHGSRGRRGGAAHPAPQQN